MYAQQSYQSSLCAQWVAKDPSFLHADSEDSYLTGQMPRLCWVHMPFCWFCHEAAHYVPYRMGEGHINFGADPVRGGVSVGVSVTLSCLPDIS